MKVKNFEVNITIDTYGKKTLMTVEEDFTVGELREKLKIPESWKVHCNWMPTVDKCVLEDWDVVEIRYDLPTLLCKMEKEIGEMRTIMTDLGYIK